jgi:hypothetical protein
MMLSRIRLLLLLAAPTALYAQAAPPVTIRLRVIDTASVPVAGADVAIMADLKEARATAVTDARGLATLTVPGGNAQREAVARKIGFARTSMFFVAHHDSIALTLVLRRPVQQLEAVKVTEREDVKRKSYHLDADDIANSKRPILDGMDAALKIRPDIIYGREPELCGGAQDIWINGKLMRGVLSNAMVQARRGITPSPGMKSSMSGRPALMPRPLRGSEAVETVLASIKPEHIAEMNFKDCFDTTVNDVHGSSALYVVLKEGIAFELNGRGSYVKDLGDLPFVADALAYRNRLLGVYDATSGEPVPEVTVTDSASGVTAKTTATGTVTLMFLPDGAATLKIAKPGYDALSLPVMISPRDTLPITVVLTKSAQVQRPK